MKGIGFKRIVASVLAVCMAAMLLPETFFFTAAADSDAEKTVISFEALDSSCAEQSVPLGQDQDALVRDGLLILPSSLTARVLVPDEPQVEPGPGFGGPEIFDESAGGGGGTYAPVQPDAVPGVVSKAVEVPVTWPEVIDGQTAGVFVLEPLLPEEYVLGEGVSAPTITVTVADARPGGDTQPDGSTEIAGFEPLESWAAEQTVPLGLGQEALIEYLMLRLPKTVTAQIGDETAEVNVTWPEDVIGGKETGVFVLEPILPEGYTLGEGVSLPKITVTVVDDEQLLWSLMPQNDASSDKQFHISGSSSTVEAGAPGGRSTYGQGTFNIQGKDGDRTYKTTYGNGGYFVVSSVDGNEIQWKNANATDVSMGSSLTGTVSGEYVYSDKYVKITYKVTNTGSTAKEFKIGTYADVMIDNNDYAKVSWITSGGSRTGISMDGAPKNSFKFSALLPDAATMWYGSFASAPRSVFENYDGDTPYTNDSGMAWSWNGTVPAGGTWTRYVLIGVGELPPAPQAPIIDITAEGGLKVKPGDTINITGSGTAGCSAHVSFFGTEYQAEIGTDERFSITVTVPADTAGGEYTFDYWAVSSEGGVSEFKKANVTVTCLPEIVLSEAVPELTEEQDEPSEDWYKSFIVKSSGTVTHTDVSTDQIGTFTITYTAHIDGYDDVTATLTYKVNPLPPGISMSAPTQQSDTSFSFTGKLDHTGGLTWTEMGFVYGSMQNPSLTFKNGQVTAAAAVQETGATFTATAEDIVKGVTYYVRPYATASDGTTIYGAQQSFGSGVPQYGTFTITNNGTYTFIVSREGGTEGTQTVYYRTVNGSAVGGTHFEHEVGTLTFAPGEATHTITITEHDVTATYNSQPATAYSNADRVYFVELYRVDGGGTLGETTRATRTMRKAEDRTVDRNCYVTKKESVDKTNNQTTSSSYANAFTMQRTYTQYVPYLKETADCYEMHMNAYVYEQTDGYEWLRFTSGSQVATIEFEINRSGNYTNWVNGWFPRTVGYTENGVIYTTALSDLTPAESNMGIGTIYRLNITTDPITVAIRATGSGSNHWELGGCEQESVYYDGKEPTLIGVAPMPSTTYKAGDTVTISLIFDEIVDSTNSSLNSSSTIDTSWGTFHYAGGADTNVLYYEYTVPENGAALSGTLQVTSLGTSAGQIKDMCSQSAASSAGGSGSTTLTVDATAPTISFSEAAVSNGTATVPVTVANATQVKYAWTNSATLPVVWQTWGDTNGGNFQTRQDPGTYYLHILAFNSSSGAQKTAHTSVTIAADGGGSGGGAMPALEVSVTNDTWARSREITVTERVPADAVITVTKPDGGTETLAKDVNIFTAEANGTYKFTITVDGETISAYANVSMIDKNAPTAAISGPETLIQSEDVTLTVTLTDGAGESGIASWEAKWNGTETATLTDNGDGTYTAKTNGSGTWTLTVKAYDNAGNVSNTATSSEYEVVTEGPTIEITKRTADPKTGVTFEYKVTHTKRIPLVSVQLPNGEMVEVNQTDYAEYSDSFTLSEEASNLYIYATDNLGHITQSEPLSVSSGEAVDVTPPDVRLNSVPFSWTNVGSVTVNVDVYDLGGGLTGEWSDGSESRSIDSFVDTRAETGAPGTYAGSFTVTKNGRYTVTVTDGNGNKGTAEIEIDFIDRRNPDVTVSGIDDHWTNAAQTVNFSVSDAEDGDNKASGVESFEYAVTAVKSASAPADLATLSPTGGSVTVGDEEDGIFYIYYKAVDNAGNETTGWSAAIKVNKQTPMLTVSGGELGNPVKTEQTLSVTSGFGISGGKVTVQKPDGSTETVSGNSCTVTEAGRYVFTATSDSGLTATRTVVICAVSFDGNGAAASPAAQLVVSGGRAVEPDKPTLAGHTFVNWEKGGAAYSFGSAVTANVGLTAKWTLNAPTVTLAADRDTAAYNNGEAVIILTATPSHEAGDDITYTYEWFKDGTKIEGAGGSTYTLDSVDDSGTYKVEVTARCGHSLISEKVTSNTVEVSVTAARPEISAPPTVAPLTYGDELTDDRLTGGSASLNGEAVEGTFSWQRRGQHPAATEGTEYSVVFTPADQDNYNAVTFTVTVTVNKKTLTPSVAADQVSGGAYDGTLYSHGSADGEIVLAGAVLGEEPTAHGQVEFVTRDVGENKPVNVRGITLDDNWGKNYELSTAELSNAPTQAEVTPIELTVVWHFSNTGDGATDMAAGWDGIYYTGKNVTVTAEAAGLVAGDECALTVGENGVRTDAGTYTAKITEFSNKNYTLPDDITREYTIHKAPVSFAVTGNEHTYDREAHTATVTQNEELSHTLTATASGGPVFTVTYGGAESRTDAGTYDIVVTLTDPDNFEFAGGGSSEKAGTLTIARAPVSFAIGAEVKPVHDWTQEINEDPNPDGYVIAGDADPAVWNDFALTMTYDSLEHRANVRQDGGLEMGDLFSVSYRRVKDTSGDAASGDAVGTFRDAGTYEIWVTLTDDARNFMFAGEEPAVRTLCVGTVTVNPYEVRVTWQNLTFVYHGHRMHPTVRVENAFLADEQPDEKEKQGFLKDPSTFHEDLMAYAATDSANAGDYLVTVTLYGSEAGNYTVSNPTAAVVIQPAPVAFEVTNNEWLYHENEEQDRDVILTAAWGEVTNAPDTVVGDSYPGAGTNITLRVLGVTAEDIQYRLADGTVVDNPTEVGTYQVWVRIPNANFRHANTAGGDFHNVGVLRIAENDHPATYTVTFDPGRDERGNRFTGITAPEPMTDLIPTQEITLPPAPENAPAGYVFAGWSQGGALYQPNEEFYMVYSDVTFEARWTKEIFSIAGVVIDDTETPIPYVSVALMMGEHQMGLTTTEEDGTFHFDGLIPNTYNLVFTWNGVVKTYMVEITDKNVEGGTYTLPGYRLNTVVEVAPGSGSVVVDLDPIITDEEASELYGADERALVEENGGTVEFMMRVESSSATEGITEKLKDVPVSTNNIGMVLDMSLTKTVTRLNPDGTAAESTVTPIDDSKVLIANLIYLPAELQGKDSYIVYRFHDENGDGENEVQTITTSANSDGERVEIVKDGTAIMVYARYYSTYVLTWYQNPMGRVDIVDTPHGTVTPDYPSADPSVKVTLTVKPDEGYETDGLTVTDIWGHEVPVTDNGDGTYSFIMPGGDVTVEAAFRSKGCDGGEDCPSRRFTDLNVEAWYHEYTDYVIAHELMRGMGGTIFAPDGTVTRAQMVMVLWNLAGGGIVNYRMTYEDVEEGTWYAEAVRWAASEGIVKGYNAAWFGPDDPITREQMATMLYRYEQKLGGGFSGDWMFRLPFADAGEVGDWAYEAVAWCSENGVIEGRDGNVFDPASSARRSEMAAVFTRYLTQER